LGSGGKADPNHLTTIQPGPKLEPLFPFRALVAQETGPNACARFALCLTFGIRAGFAIASTAAPSDPPAPTSTHPPFRSVFVYSSRRGTVSDCLPRRRRRISRILQGRSLPRDRATTFEEHLPIPGCGPGMRPARRSDAARDSFSTRRMIFRAGSSRLPKFNFTIRLSAIISAARSSAFSRSRAVIL